MTTLPVNYIRHANAFSEHIKINKCLNPNHISLYWALFYTWNRYHFTEMFPVNRKKLMALSRIGSTNTYARCMKDLDACKLITYMPAARFGNVSYVSISRLSTKGELVVDNSFSGISCDTDTRLKTAAAAGINTDTGVRIETDTTAVSEPLHFNKQSLKKSKRESKRVKMTVDKSVALLEVLKYFASAGLPEQEGRKFFYHYEAIGWKFGKIPMLRWQSAAHKWVENISSFNKNTYDNDNTTPGNITVKQDKRYDIPL